MTVPSLLSTINAVLAVLQRSRLITSEECKGLSVIHRVVRVQRGKSPEVVAKTADVLRRHGFVEMSRLLAGRQSSTSSVCLCHCCTVEPPYDGHLVPSTTVH